MLRVCRCVCQCVCQCVTEKNKSINISHVRSLLGWAERKKKTCCWWQRLFFFSFFHSFFLSLSMTNWRISLLPQQTKSQAQNHDSSHFFFFFFFFFSSSSSPTSSELMKNELWREDALIYFVFHLHFFFLNQSMNWSVCWERVREGGGGGGGGVWIHQNVVQFEGGADSKDVELLNVYQRQTWS